MLPNPKIQTGILWLWRLRGVKVWICVQSLKRSLTVCQIVQRYNNAPYNQKNTQKVCLPVLYTVNFSLLVANIV